MTLFQAQWFDANLPSLLIPCVTNIILRYFLPEKPLMAAN